MTCDITQTAANLKVSRAGRGRRSGSDRLDVHAGRQGLLERANGRRRHADGRRLQGQVGRQQDRHHDRPERQDGTKTTTTQTLAIEGGKLTISTTSSAAPDQPARVQTYTKG
jgi:hypothetical protein